MWRELGELSGPENMEPGNVKPDLLVWFLLTSLTSSPTSLPSLSMFQPIWPLLFQEPLPFYVETYSFPRWPGELFILQSLTHTWLPSKPARITTPCEHLVNRKSRNGSCLMSVYSVLYIVLLRVHSHLEKEGFFSLCYRLEWGRGGG